MIQHAMFKAAVSTYSDMGAWIWAQDVKLSSDAFIQKTKKLYVDTKTTKNLNRLNEVISICHKLPEHQLSFPMMKGSCDLSLPSLFYAQDLADVQKIMTQNIQDVLGRGDQLDCASRTSCCYILKMYHVAAAAPT